MSLTLLSLLSFDRYVADDKFFVRVTDDRKDKGGEDEEGEEEEEDAGGEEGGEGEAGKSERTSSGGSIRWARRGALW